MKYVLMILTFLALLGCVEIGLKIFWLDTQEKQSVPNVGIQMQAHPTRIWALQPNSNVENFGVHIKVDSLGMREGIDVENEDLRLMILGDSSFFGHGLEHQDTLQVHLAEAFEHQGVKTDVLCGAVPGYSVLQSSVFMDEIGWDLHPTMLVIGTIWSDNHFDHFVDQEWMDTLQSPLYRWQQSMMRSALWQFALYVMQRKSKEELGPLARISWVKAPKQKPQRRVSLEQYASVLDTMIETAGQKGIEVVMIQPANRDRLYNRHSTEMWYPYFVVQKSIAIHRNIPILDVAEILQLFGMSAETAFLDEMHPTGEANYWIAQSLVNALLLDGWPQKTKIPNIAIKTFPKSQIPKDPFVDVGDSVQDVEKQPTRKENEKDENKNYPTK